MYFLISRLTKINSSETSKVGLATLIVCEEQKLHTLLCSSNRWSNFKDILKGYANYKDFWECPTKE